MTQLRHQPLFAQKQFSRNFFEGETVSVLFDDDEWEFEIATVADVKGIKKIEEGKWMEGGLKE